MRAMPAATSHPELVEVAIFPPYPWLLGIAEVVEGTNVNLGAQDCFWELSGAYTGEVSPAMLKGWCPWVIIGHSERRAYLGETDDMVARKTVAAKTNEIVTAQVKAGLGLCSADDSARLVIAYEPVWAIGSGKSAEPEHAYTTMRSIRRIVGELIGAGAARKVRVLYGGSVNASNVESYVELPLCDGCLVGGASLNAEEFAKIVEVTAGVYRHR